ncbi:DUF305 domain-containing protein [Micromonospora sp. NPDC049230]|uniref:DUF305 domain-containing protein n=1 Tax=Micromonospora sp. NPDC049230 TaxID=3155502 RepID=UPI0033BFF520
MRIARPTALLAAMLLAAGCTTGPRDAAGTTGPATTVPAATAVPTPWGTTGTFSPTDVAWLQLTVAMADRLLPVLDLVPARTTDPAWRRLAAEVGAAQRDIADRSRRLLADSGAPTTNPHEGHDMPGMVTADEVNALRSSTGQQFLRLLAGHLRAHLGQSVRVATAERRSGVHPATIVVAETVVRGGTARLAGLDRLDRPPSAVDVSPAQRLPPV